MIGAGGSSSNSKISLALPQALVSHTHPDLYGLTRTAGDLIWASIAI
jgi:hypothetical protein